MDPDCLARAAAKLGPAFAKANFANGGSCPGTAATTAPVIDACVAQIVGDTPDTGGCSAIKRTAAGKKVLGKLVCQAKGPGLLPACLVHAEAKFAASFGRAGQCAGTAAAVETDVDTLCVDPIVALATTTSTSTTSTTTSSSTSTTNTLPPCCDCCGPERIVLRSGGGPGTLKLGGFFPYPFPPNATLTIDTGAPDATCRHDVVIPAGGLDIPAFCTEPTFTVKITANGCASGGTDGAGALWDGRAVLHGGAPQTNVSGSFDSSDGTCDVGADICNNRDLNLLGNVDTTVGPGGDASKVSTRFDIPAHLRIWQESSGCPGNGTYNPAEGDTLVTEFDFLWSLTTGVASGQFADQNGDACELPAGSAGFGPPSPQCAAGPKGPCSATGSEALGPCCLGGQSATLVAVGASFSNGFPLYDLGLVASVPFTVQSCEAPAGGSCVVTTDTCEM